MIRKVYTVNTKYSYCQITSIVPSHVLRSVLSLYPCCKSTKTSLHC